MIRTDRNPLKEFKKSDFQRPSVFSPGPGLVGMVILSAGSGDQRRLSSRDRRQRALCGDVSKAFVCGLSPFHSGSAKRCGKGFIPIDEVGDEVKSRAASYAEFRRAKEARALRRRR